MSRIEDLLGNGIEETFDPELKRAFDFDDNQVDPKLRVAENVRLDPNQLRVSGDASFYTLQGEGPTMGRPATFLRLHVCNLRCVWCDAWYTWNPKTTEFWTESQLWQIDDARRRIVESWKAPQHTQKRLVLTGGEPLLQQKQIEELIRPMKDWEIEIETNGTVMPSDELLERCQFNCSPKLRNSQNSDPARIKKDVLTRLNTAKTVFKFVVMQEGDIDEIEQDFILPMGLDTEKILLMPQGVTADEVRKNAQRLVEVAKAKGYRMLGRLQTEIWGARRKV